MVVAALLMVDSRSSSSASNAVSRRNTLVFPTWIPQDTKSEKPSELEPLLLNCASSLWDKVLIKWSGVNFGRPNLCFDCGSSLLTITRNRARNEEWVYLIEYPVLASFMAGRTPAQFNWCAMSDSSRWSGTSRSFGFIHLQRYKDIEISEEAWMSALAWDSEKSIPDVMRASLGNLGAQVSELRCKLAAHWW